MVEFAGDDTGTRREAVASSTVSTPPRSLGRAVRGGLLFILYSLYLVFGVGLPQRLVVFPLAKLLPTRRDSILGAWLHFHARATVRIAQFVGNIRIRVRGSVPPGSCIAVMNHQSILDIPLALSLVHDPLTLIPYRGRYHRFIPGISPLLRATGMPQITQHTGGRKPGAAARDLKEIQAAADRVARGECSMVIFPEGHRTRTGEIERFMRRGLTVIFARAKHPVYCLVVDGLWQARTVADAARSVGGSSVNITVLGPFAPPPDDQIDAFIASLRERMTGALGQMRAEAW